MPLTPEEFTKRYLPITFNACVGDPDSGEITDGNVLSVHIRNYINANNRLEPPPKNNPKGPRAQKVYEEGKGMPYYELKDQVRGFLLNRQKAKTFGIKELFGAFYCPDVTPYIVCKQVSLMHAFTGKIGPASLQQVLCLLSYYYDQMPSLQHRYPSLQNLADRCLGLDCNGLVGAYFESEYSWLGIGPNTDISKYDTKPLRQKVRTSLKELRPCDVILFPNYHHIAVISSVPPSNFTTGGSEPSEIACRVSQSRSAELGGVITSELTIVKDRQGFHFKGGGEYFKNIVQVLPEGA
jgi:hypothetical protein